MLKKDRDFKLIQNNDFYITEHSPKVFCYSKAKKIKIKGRDEETIQRKPSANCKIHPPALIFQHRPLFKNTTMQKLVFSILGTK